MTAQAGKPLTAKIASFAVIGVANSLIDLAVFGAGLKAGLHPLAANGMGWAAAVVFSFLANRRFTFDRAAELKTRNSALRFVVTGAAISLGVSTLAVAALSAVFGVWPAKLIGLVTAAILNYFAARWSIEDRLR